MCMFNGRLSFFGTLCRRWCYSVFVIIVFCLSLNASEEKVNRMKREVLSDSLQSYLMKFGYMKESKDGAFALRTEESIRKALSDMQEFAGLPVTGQLDERTKKLMATPRCGVPDKEVRPNRTKRFAIHVPKWPYTSLTWSIRTKHLENLDHNQVRYVMSKAFEVWSKHSQLTFTEVDSDNADLLIYFHRGDHHDNFPFDGRGTILAHAFFPTGLKTSVEIHFDADEYWTTDADSEEGTNLFNVAAHEIGHSLGLSHSTVESALMFSWYKKMDNGFDYELPDDDKQAIQFLYGARDNRRKWAKNPIYRPIPTTTRTTTTTTTTSTTTTTTSRPRTRGYIHRPKIPYYPRDPQGRPYVPRDPQQRPHEHYPQKPMYPKKHYPKQNSDQYPYIPERRNIPHKHNTERIPDRKYPDRGYTTIGYPTRRPDYYPKESPTKRPPPDTCDTSYDAITVIRQEVFIFKDAYFWRIGANGLLPDYPASIHRLWHGLPHNLTHVDAVYERNDGRIVFFIGDLYYVFSTNNVDNGYPKPLTNLGISKEIKHIDGAMVWGHNGKTYFYSEDMYWRFDEEQQYIELDYPRHISRWGGVGSDIDAVFQWKDGKTYFFKGKGFWKFNDLHMRVENAEQTLSAPFWMGCTTNYRKNDKQKSPRIAMIPSTASKHNYISTFTLTVLLFLYLPLRDM